MNKVVVSLIVFLIVSFSVGFYLQNQQNKEFTRWSKKCLNYSGTTMIIEKYLFSERVECVKDGKIISY